LNILRERGMVNAQRDGQSVVYQLADERTIQALDLLRAILGDNLKSRGQLAQVVLDVE
jgi:DNA-binding transcriptional ArsR family regulator